MLHGYNVRRQTLDAALSRTARDRMGQSFRPAPGEPDAAGAVQRYRVWVMERPQLLARLPELRGKTLGCWRPPLGGLYGDLDGRVCHGQVLAALADGLPAAEE